MYIEATESLENRFPFVRAGKWRLIEKAAFLELRRENGKVYAVVRRALDCNILAQIVGACDKVLTEDQIERERPPEWEFLTSQDNSGGANDGRPLWAIRKTVAGYV